jgi:acyl-CoA reductase-like NAD-dependent aldehyde dehydrogenase
LKKNSEYFLGDGANCGNAIAAHQEIDKVAFTGSVEVRILKLNR